MKKAVATFCLIGSTLALAACDTSGMGYIDTDPPYAMERTATHEHPAPAMVPVQPAPADPIFHDAQMK